MKYIILSATLILLAIGYGIYRLNQPPEGISKKNADYVISPEKLLKEFETNEDTANKKYLDKIVEVEGKVNSISSSDSGRATLLIETHNPMRNISCQLNSRDAENNKRIKTGDTIKIKGICTGLLMDVVLVECVVLNNK